MVHPTRPPAALSIIASSLLAFGVVAVGVQLGEGGLGDDPRRPSPVLTRPAARVVVPIRNAEPPLAQQFLDIDSAPRERAQPNTIPVLAPGPQSVPVPGPSTDETAAPAPEPPPSEPVPTPEVVSPLPPPDTQVLDPVVTLIEGLLGTGSEEAGAEAPTSTVTGLLGL